MAWHRGYQKKGYPQKKDRGGYRPRSSVAFDCIANARTESQEQADLIAWANLQGENTEALRYLAAIPNGGYRHKATARRLKAEGVKAGFPDLILAWPCGKYHGLFIEMKRAKKSKIEPSQKEWLWGLQARGFACAVCKGFEAAKETIEKYLSGQFKNEVIL